MEYRIGKCSSCGAEYKIPSSFAHDVARCKVCAGVVHIARSPSPSRPREPRADAPSGTVVPRAAARSVAGNDGARQERREAAHHPPRRSQGAERREERDAGERTGAPAGPSPAAAASLPLAPAAHAPEQPLEVRASAPSAAAEARAEPSTRGGTGAAPRPQVARGARSERVRVPTLLIGAGLLVLAVAAWFLRGRVFGASSAASSDVAAKETTQAGGAGAVANAQAPRSLADFGPARGTSDAEWAEMEAWLATWLEAEPGTVGERTRDLLVAKSYEALPLLVDHLRRLDLSTAAGQDRGQRLQAALNEICAGRGFDWKTGSAPADVAFNERAVLDWAALWQRASSDVTYLLEVLALEPASAEADRIRASYAAAPAETPPGGTSGEKLDES